jgi:hypothetical protein
MVEGIRFRFIDQPAGGQLKLARKAKRAKEEVGVRRRRRDGGAAALVSRKMIFPDGMQSNCRT